MSQPPSSQLTVTTAVPTANALHSTPLTNTLMLLPAAATSSNLLDQMTFEDNALVSTQLPTTHFYLEMAKLPFSKVRPIIKIPSSIPSFDQTMLTLFV
jgi:hypothetical protein